MGMVRVCYMLLVHNQAIRSFRGVMTAFLRANGIRLLIESNKPRLAAATSVISRKERVGDLVGCRERLRLVVSGETID